MAMCKYDYIARPHPFLLPEPVVLANLNARRYLREGGRVHALEYASGVTEGTARGSEPIALRSIMARSTTLARVAVLPA